MPQQLDQNMNMPAAQDAEQAQQQIQAALAEANLPAEKLVEIGEWAQRVIQDPNEFAAFQAWLKSQGLPDEDIPKEPDFQELTSMVAIGHVASGMTAAPAESAAPSAGPISPDQLQSMAGQGRMGDTMLAHINPQEAAVLQSMGGVGTINPATGLPEYGFFSDLWKGVKKVVKQVAPFVLPVVAIAFPALIPAIGTAMGASAAFAPIVGAAVISGGVTALSGGSVKDVLKSAALTGLGAYLTPIVGEYVGSSIGVTSPALQSVIGSATLAGGMTALRGGTVSQILASAATGAAANYLGTVASNAINSGAITNKNITQKTFDDAVFAAADAKGLADAGLGEAQIAQVLKSTGMQDAVASSAAAAAKAGQTADQIAVSLSNRYGGATFAGQKSLYQNNADPAAKSLIGGANVPALEQVQRAEDALFVGEAAKSVKDTLASQGITGRAAQPAIEQNLVAMGIDPKAAAYAADSVISGKIPAAVGDGLLTGTSFKGTTLIGTPPQSATAVTPGLGAASLGETPLNQTVQSPATPATPSAGGNVTEAEFIAADAKQLAQTLNNNTAAVEQALTYGGVDPVNAAQAANMAVSGATPAQIAAAMIPARPAWVPPEFTTTQLESGQTVYRDPNSGNLMNDAGYIVEYGSGPQQATAPVVPETTPAPAPAPAAETTTATAPAPAPAPAPSQGTRSWNPISSGRPGTELGYVTTDAAGRQIWTSDDGTLSYQRSGAGWDRTPLFDLSGNQPTQLQPGSTPGGNVSEAEFIAADAAQLAAQTGNNAAAVQQNLIYAGVDPVIAAQAANMAVSGATIPQITQAIAGDTNQSLMLQVPPGTTAPAPSTGNQSPLGGGISTEMIPASSDTNLVGQTPTAPGFQPGDLGTGITEPVYPNLPEMGGGQGLIVPGVTPEITTPVLTPEPPPLTDAQTGAIVATPTIPDPLAPLPTPGRPNQGTFTPAPPDPSWSQALQYPGVNPGLVGAAVRPAYETTSPVQSQYYWGRQPYFAYTDDLAKYNQVAMPTTPFGIQQGYFEQPLALPEIPVYGENMFVVPQAQPQQFQAFAAPQAQTAQAFYPQQLFPIAPQMPVGSPNYIYDIRPTAGQYSS